MLRSLWAALSLRRTARLPGRRSLLPTALAILLGPPLLAAQAPARAPLGIFGFAPGDSLRQIRAALSARHGSGWVCRGSRADASVVECRGSFPDPLHRNPVTLWLSAIDGRAGILTLQAMLTPAGLAEWQDGLSASYGPAPAERRGPLRMMQWIRSGRMLRLTWHAGARGIEASISLVDGGILDRWGRPRSGG